MFTDLFAFLEPNGKHDFHLERVYRRDTLKVAEFLIEAGCRLIYSDNYKVFLGTYFQL